MDATRRDAAGRVLCAGRLCVSHLCQHALTTLPTLLLSIIIPAHNEENRLPRSLEQVFSFLAGQAYDAEVLVVENGSTDRTLELAQRYAQEHTGLRVIHEDRRGKGLAVRR